MKKIILVSGVLAIMGAGAVSVYAGSPSTNEFDHGYGHMVDNRSIQGRFNKNNKSYTDAERQQWLDERAEYREERIQLALSEGWITEEEAAERRAELVERDQSERINDYTNERYSYGGRHRGYRHTQGYGCH